MQHKQRTIEHIIETMFSVQSKHEDQVRFIISGDFNKVNIQDVLDSNGVLQQVCSVATRQSTTLELVITDMATMLHLPATREPLEQNQHSKGKPSDHNVIIVAPKTDITFKIERHKTKIHIRPQPVSKVTQYMQEMGHHSWTEVFQTQDPHDKAHKFHETLTAILDKHLKTKTVKMSSLDKPWFNPALKLKYSEMQKEYYKNAKSAKWKKLRQNFRSSKRKTCKELYSNFVTKMKSTQPGQYHRIAKQIGTNSNNGNLVIECIKHLDPQKQVEKVAESFANVSQQYDPVNLKELPAYLPSEEPPQLEVYKVLQKIQNLKRTKSTLPIDIPENLRKEAAVFLAEPLTDIFNTCLR